MGGTQSFVNGKWAENPKTGKMGKKKWKIRPRSKHFNGKNGKTNTEKMEIEGQIKKSASFLPNFARLGETFLLNFALADFRHKMASVQRTHSEHTKHSSF